MACQLLKGIPSHTSDFTVIHLALEISPRSAPGSVPSPGPHSNIYMHDTPPTPKVYGLQEI